MELATSHPYPGARTRSSGAGTLPTRPGRIERGGIDEKQVLLARAAHHKAAANGGGGRNLVSGA